MKGAFSFKMWMLLPLVLLVAAGCQAMRGRLTVPPGNSRLVAAAEGGDLEEVKRLLVRGMDANEKDWALIKAASRAPHGRTEIVELLLETGANANAQTPIDDPGSLVLPGFGLVVVAAIGGETALMGAAQGGYIETVKVLLARGAEVNTKNGRGETALMQAVGRGHVNTVKLLLANGADPNAKDDDGKTPLMRSIDDPRFSNIAEVEALLAVGAKVNEKDNNGRAVLMVAISRWNDADIIQRLLAKGTEVNTKDKKGKTALMLAAENGRPDVAELLKKAGAKE